jgi:membrane protease YdiL (CAAX protease family)
MLTLVYAIRSATVVFGIAAFGTLISRLVANSGLREYLILHQLSIPGSLYMVNALESFTYAFAVLLIAYLFSGFYWRDLFPDRIHWPKMFLALIVGVGFAMFLNHPAHVFLFDQFFDQRMMNGGQTSDSVVGGIFSGLRGANVLLSMPAFATMFATPFIEELTDRGILFREGERLAIWQLAILSFLVFTLSHFAIGGMAKVLAVAPAAALFVATRVVTKSFVYSAAAHVGVNVAALMKLQVW